MSYADKTKKELYSLAKEKEVSGYSSMSKEELVKALEALGKKKEVKKEEAPSEPEKKLVFNPMLHRYEYK